MPKKSHKPRKYLLVHEDNTGVLTVTIPKEIARKQRIRKHTKMAIKKIRNGISYKILR